MKKIIFLVFIILNIYSQVITPLEESAYTKLTTNNMIINFLFSADSLSNFIILDTLALSSMGYPIPFVKITNENLKKEKLKVLIFAQQHGNEHSGKEAVLLFIKELVNKNKDIINLLNQLEIFIIPSLNPEGNEKNNRMNSNNVDLNRNHIILTEPETIALHKLFNSFLPEVTLDMHEYYPYGEEWSKSGYRKNYDIQIGVLSNLNIDKNLLDNQKNKFLPFMKKYLNQRGYTFNEYIVGGPPNKSRVRFSTVDINDGRQSFGILNTFSCIFEGINGKESIDNIKKRTNAQFTSLVGFLNYVADNFKLIKRLIYQARNNLKSNTTNKIILRMEHFFDKKQKLSFLSLKSNKDTVLSVNNFHTKIKNLKSTKSPIGYLIPKNFDKLINLLKKHDVAFSELPIKIKLKYYQYFIKKYEIEIIEDQKSKIPILEKEIVEKVDLEKYLFISLKQINSKKIQLLLEPESMMGLIQQKEYQNFFNIENEYSILRVE